MSSPGAKVAFVTGANGITGNAIIEHLIRQPKTEWSKIVITSRRTPTQVFWQDPRIRFVALDFLKPVDELVAAMKPWCHDVTHAFFASYVHTADFAKLRDYNVPLFQNFLQSIDTVAASSLKRICLSTGGKVPIHEDMPRYEDKGENFYYPQEDFLFDLAAKRRWDWNIIRPNAIIGFTPAGNGMSAALTLAIYILTCREMGEVPVFPGNKFFYNSVDDSSYAPSLADMNVWAATSENTKNEAFNHTNGDVFVWKYFWPKLGKYFGIDFPDTQEWKASGEGQRMEHNFLMTQWAKDKEPIWRRVVEKHGGNPDAFGWGTWDFFDWAVGKAWFTIGSVSKARKFGWTRYDDTYDTWIETFRAFENAGVLPIAPPPSREPVQAKLAPHPADAVAAQEAAARKAREPEQLQEEAQKKYLVVDSKRDFEIGHVETVEIVSS
ncbi:NAD-dependent epimerase/dehydratase [Plectosphaerella plurivora]|uniref:NAD-dependent epimerase/dehydratase n=1 Tax=Plectosphaerella plurivora TaxID=936078 RepID=A0A9P8VDN6_9PEZI|nr:NAD-dependent epimerase/dehydratase [Plectosphaerella plurivora]